MCADFVRLSSWFAGRVIFSKMVCGEGDIFKKMKVVLAVLVAMTNSYETSSLVHLRMTEAALWASRFTNSLSC